MLDKIKRIDWTIFAILAVFMIFSSVLIYSATMDSIYYGSDLHIKALLNFALGFLVLIGASIMDYRLLLKFSGYLYVIGIVLLVAVYFFGEEVNGARSWFKLPLGFNFQPAELEKLILIVSIAGFIARRKGEPLEFFRDVVPIAGIVFLPFALVLIQPDLGNAIIYIVILLGMLWIGNIKYSYVLIGTALFAGFLALFLYSFVTYHDQIQHFLEKRGSGHWVERIDTFLYPDKASSDAIYQVKKAKIAIGSGELNGEGFLRGNSVHSGFIPLPFSDSIFVVIGEEFGFIGSSLLLILYFLLIYRMILISIQNGNLSGSIIILGAVSMFVFQIFENIGMLIGIMPLTGITLPFVSYGGTSVLINMLSLGIVMSIRVHQDELSLFE
ncbi:FtsW/RodA/SpoVE family cell cycle protein [Ferviditalea candida]|uniref:FtsW/RodA/SpoVE family cell cycle protein n=1 Tax=Ferviditalea candida TaxID=3108399 RepID=A0ABU5ZD08_9BACL|nr:FtsW/RodA/SpoVE family cell cycle protein [Paenibacillaceae bacterium T2]